MSLGHRRSSVRIRLARSPVASASLARPFTLQPVDVVKTRIQLDPIKYKGMIGGFKQVIAAEGAGALLTGLGATVAGYTVQG